MTYIYGTYEPEKVNYPEFAEKHGFGGNIVKKHMLYRLITEENIFSLSCEKGIMKEESGIYPIAVSEVGDIIKKYKTCGANAYFGDYKPLIPCKYDITEEFLDFKSPEDLVKRLVSFHSARGCGEFALYKGFRLSRKGELLPVKIFDPITFDNIFCYERQLEALEANTVSFLEGKPARNTLLFGARGTGKSSSVKALINKYFDKGLRLIEASKDDIHLLPELMPTLSERNFKFIVFIDDLSFEAEETSYKHLKSVLEGSAEVKPGNVIFYATSNRRHIIAEKWDDRGDISQKGEMHTSDQINEKISLSDRFGLKLTFTRPSQKEFIEIVKGIAIENGIEPTEGLIAAAKTYEMSAGGFSGRVARQFIESIICGGETL